MKRGKLLDEAIHLLGYDSRNLISCAKLNIPDPESLTEVSEWLILEQARRLSADYVYCRTFDNRPSQAQLYIYDYSEKANVEDGEIGILQRNVWSAGTVPCIMVFSRDSVRIINTNQQPDISEEGFSPTDILPLATSIHEEIQRRFSHFRLDSGVFWQEEHENFAFNKSAHKTLLDKLREVRSAFFEGAVLEPDLVNRLLIQCVLVRYLEEKKEVDEYGKVHKVFPDVFFQEIAQASSFRESLENGTFLKVFDKLNDPAHLNGKIFEWPEEERVKLQEIPVQTLVSLLYQTDTLAGGQMALWDLYSFRHLPVEVISSIYEALFSTTEEVSEHGMVYTPPHLAAFLVDEAMPLTAWQGKEQYVVCDPSCGSGVFLVLAFKRMAHWWRLRHNGTHPMVSDLTQILSTNLYGIDKNPGAVLLTRFSLCLAVCDMLTPPEIWDKFHFPDLTNQLVAQDFFEWQKSMSNSVSFDLLIGNPPFVSASKSLPDWKDISTIKIPQKQIALYFLSAGMQMVKPGGLLCLLLKSSSLLYTTNGQKYRKQFFQENKVHQVIDLTLLARNGVLWSKEEPDTIALFASKERPDFEKNILHLVVRRTPSTRVRRFFEIDNYDFHWVPYAVALEDDFVWKCNLLGGGRLYGLVKRLRSHKTLRDFTYKNLGIIGEGYRKNGAGEQREEKAVYLSDKSTLPTNWLTDKGIISFDFPTEEDTNFYSVRRKELFEWPHVVIREIIGEKELHVDMVNFHSGYQRDIVGIAFKDVRLVNQVFKLLKENNFLFRLYILSTSTRCLVFKNTSIRAEDIYNLPYPIDKNLLPKEYNILSRDVSEYYQYLIRRPESAAAFHPITSKNFDKRLSQFGTLFCESLNALYAKNSKQFRQAESGYIHNREFIYTAFQYDDNADNRTTEIKDLSSEEVENLLTLDKGHVRFQRILKIYKKDYVCFIKPNQLRYWLDSIAFRDADGVINDLFENGY
jgi:type I restriction-modification system DNA methylase subunit